MGVAYGTNIGGDVYAFLGWYPVGVSKHSGFLRLGRNTSSSSCGHPKSPPVEDDAGMPAAPSCDASHGYQSRTLMVDKLEVLSYAEETMESYIDDLLLSPIAFWLTEKVRDGE